LTGDIDAYLLYKNHEELAAGDMDAKDEDVAREESTEH